jgi:hypothetical protein
MNKISLPVVITVMCVIISMVLGLSYLNQENKKGVSPTDMSDVSVQTSGEQNITRTDYSSVVRKTLDWIDKQRNDEEWYILERGCDFEAKTCETVWDNDEGNKDGLIVTWARFNYYQQTKDPKDLEIVKSDINKFYEKYPNGVDNALWICKITYDMWNSDLFDNKTKDKLEKICFDSDFEKDILDEISYVEKMEKTGEVLNEADPIWGTWFGYSSSLRGFDNYFALPSDLISQYQWENDESKLEEANKYFKSAKEIVSKTTTILRPENYCLVALSALDLYEFGGKDEENLDYAKEMFFDLLGDKNKVKTYRTTLCGLFSKRLYQLTGDDLFLDDLEKNNRVLVELILDEENSKFSTINDNGFYVASIGGGGFMFKNVVENGLIVELLRN